MTTHSCCSHEIKRCLLLGRKVMTNLDSILKSRHITLSTKVHLVKAMVFPVVTYGCESWLWRKLSAEELMLLNCGVGEDSCICKEIQPVHPKGDLSWVFIGSEEGIRRAWTPSQACPCWSCSGGLWTLRLVPVGTTMEEDPLRTGEPWRSYPGYSSPKRKQTLITPASRQYLSECKHRLIGY